MSKNVPRIFSSTVDLRAQLPVIQNQGQRPTCVAFAVTSCHEVHGSYEKLSEEFLYRCCKKSQNNEDDGTTVPVAFDALVRLGQATAVQMPYQSQFTSPILTSPTPISSYRDARSRKLHGWKPVHPAHGEVESVLASGVPVVAVVEVQQGFFEANTSQSFIDVPSASQYKDVLHAIVLVGYGQDNYNSPYYLIRNSWGTSWGVSGYGYLSYSYFHRFGRGAWSIC